MGKFIFPVATDIQEYLRKRTSKTMKNFNCDQTNQFDFSQENRLFSSNFANPQMSEFTNKSEQFEQNTEQPVSPEKVIFSEAAYGDIVLETHDNPTTETGGILLGYRVEQTWYVIEAIDPGPNSVLQPAYFEYNTEYVNHLANIRARRYPTPLELLGLWHRHPGSFDRFSAIDNETNHNFASLHPQGAISGIVNVDPSFRLTMYHVGIPLTYTKIPVSVGDELIPQHLRQLKNYQDYLGLSNSFTSKKKNNSSHPDRKQSGKNKSSLGNKLKRVLPWCQINSPKIASSSSPNFDLLEEMLWTELADLEQDSNYRGSCQYDSEEGLVYLALQYVGDLANNSDSLDIDCLIFLGKNNERKIQINGQNFDYKPHILKEFLHSFSSGIVLPDLQN
jgi:proteasome lid subunit RPN8/RPN11